MCQFLAFLFNLLFWSNNNRTKFSSHHNQVLVACFKKTCTLLCCMSVLQALGKTHSVHISADFSLCALLSSQGIFVRDKTHTCALGGEGVVEEGDMYQQHICWGHFPNWGGDHCPQGRGAGPVRIQQLEEDWLSAVMSPSVLVLQGSAGNWVFDVVDPPSCLRVGENISRVKVSQFSILNFEAKCSTWFGSKVLLWETCE